LDNFLVGELTGTFMVDFMSNPKKKPKGVPLGFFGLTPLALSPFVLQFFNR
jgi:hypothetical protein